MTKKKNPPQKPAPQAEVTEPIEATSEPADTEAKGGIMEAMKDGRTGLQVAIGVVLGVVLAVAVVFCAITGFTAFSTAQKVETITQEQITQDETTAKIEEKVAEHVHTWVPNYENVHHEAQVQNVWHEPVYSQETTYHSVCNDCKKVIDGIAADHIADTGHSGYSTNVPIVNEVLVQAGYSEPVVVQEAWDEVVVSGATCTSCGEQASADEVAADDTIAIAAQG